MRSGSFSRSAEPLTPWFEALADEDEAAARERLEKAHGLPPSRWGEVWGDTQEEEEDIADSTLLELLFPDDYIS